ncbi:hypothetical protein QM012_005481 [Aureobasidium pullulans]|uniref:Amidohydrolase 3 domain-containing protein n=1 Tax=Aureobasidium pullulans TaxID=5580 RepID=A0ABR0T604_AURPU
MANKTVFRNGLVFTGQANASNSTRTGALVVVEGDRIVAVDDEASEASQQLLQDSDIDIVDLQGRSLLPAFVDSHMHLLQFGESLNKADLSNCKNLHDIRTVIVQTAKQKPHAPRLLFRGWYQDSTDGEASAAMIDDLDPRPIYIDAFDLHSVWCNTAAVKEMGLKDIPDMQGGEICKDEKGNPTGHILEAAVFTVVVPFLSHAATREQNEAALRSALTAYNHAGYTSVADLAMDEAQWNLLVSNKAELTLRVAAFWLVNPSEDENQVLAQVDKAIEMRRIYNEETSPDLKIQGIKLICDGTVDGCTAALHKPYSHNGADPHAFWEPAILEKVVRKASQAGLQCALHAIGDKTVNLAINALAAANSPQSRHRIEHLELTTTEDAQRLGKLGILASVQPVHSDPHILKAWPRYIGEDRCRRAFAYKEFVDHGAHIAFGTDAPTAAHFPFPNLYTATTRRSAIDPCLETRTNEHFKVDLFSAMTAVTRGAAYSMRTEYRVGTIEVGKQADLVIADLDWNEAGNLLQAKTHETWFSGRRVFARN